MSGSTGWSLCRAAYSSAAVMSAASEQRVVLQNLVAVGTGRQQVEHVLDADAQAGTPAALVRVEGDAMYLTRAGTPSPGAHARSTATIIIIAEIVRAAR